MTCWFLSSFVAVLLHSTIFFRGILWPFLPWGSVMSCPDSLICKCLSLPSRRNVESPIIRKDLFYLIPPSIYSFSFCVKEGLSCSYSKSFSHLIHNRLINNCISLMMTWPWGAPKRHVTFQGNQNCTAIKRVQVIKQHKITRARTACNYNKKECNEQGVREQVYI